MSPPASVTSGMYVKLFNPACVKEVVTGVTPVPGISGPNLLAANANLGAKRGDFFIKVTSSSRKSGLPEIFVSYVSEEGL